MRRSPRHRLAAPLVVAVVLVAGCSTGDANAPDPLASFGGTSITITARNLQFAPDSITAPAGQPLRLVLDNQDAGVPHNIKVSQGDTVLGQTPTVTGTGLGAVVLPALAPGQYQFQCTIHPSMLGTLVVVAGASPGAALPGGTSPAGAGPTQTALPVYTAPASP